ncbi:MAG TPA: hypothetical protein PKX94_08570, partial [Opitutales bacterium]|nr:hypothetical protein [Opitutales bacterium]
NTKKRTAEAAHSGRQPPFTRASFESPSRSIGTRRRPRLQPWLSSTAMARSRGAGQYKEEDD